MTSPLVEVNSASLGAWTSAVNGVNVALGEVVSVRLADTSGVKVWALSIFSSDPDVIVPAISGPALPTSVATFTAPSTPTEGWTLLFLSQVGATTLGKDVNFTERSDYSARFGVFYPTAGGWRLFAKDETFESSQAHGWAKDLNQMAKAPPGAGGPPSGSASGDLALTYPSPSVKRVNQQYVPWKSSVRFAITSNVSNLAAFTVATSEGTAAQGDRVLLTAQTTASQNGIYSVGVVGGGTAALTRASDMSASQDTLAGSKLHVYDGTLWANTTWTLGTSGAITLGSTSLQFTPDRVATLAALRLVAGKFAGEHIELATHSFPSDRAYNQPFIHDNGGGSFIWQVADAYNLLPSDDGGINIRVAGHTDGWWRRRVSGGLIDVRWFGARGDFEAYDSGLTYTTAAGDQVAFFNYALVDGQVYVGKTLSFKYDGGFGVYTGLISAYNAGTHNFTVSPTPAHDATNKPFLYATDNTAAFQAAADYCNQLTSTFYTVGYDLRSARLLVARGAYYVPSSITTPVGMTGDNASIRGNPGSSNLFVPASATISGHYSFDHIVFYNFHSTLKTWDDEFDGLQANLVYQDCKFQNVDYAVMNARNGNMFLAFDHCEMENSRAAKGFFVSLSIKNACGTSIGATPTDNFTNGTLGTFTDGYILAGGTEDGLRCPAFVGCIVQLDALNLSPLVNPGTGAVDGQAWIIARRAMQLTINACRFGGEFAGMPLLRMEEEFDLSALNALIDEIFTDLNAHFVLTSGGVHGAADSADVVSGVTYPPATDTATRIARLNACASAYELHRVKTAGSVHGAADNTNVAVRKSPADDASTAITLAVDDASAMALAISLKAKYNAHRVLTAGSVHGAADNTNVVSAADPFHASADGSIIAISCGTEAVSSNLPAIVFQDAAPGRMAISADSEVGNFAGVGQPIYWSQVALDRVLKRQTPWMKLAMDLGIGSLPNKSEAAISQVPGSSAFPSTPMLMAERTYSARERMGFPAQSFDTSGTVFDASSATANTGSVGTDFGNAFNILHLPGIKYYSVDSSPASGTLVKYFPESLAAGWYTAILPYRNKGLGTSTCSFSVRSGGAVPLDVALEDTDGEHATASYTFYHDGSAVVHDHPMTVSFVIPPGGASTNFIEFAPASLVRGRWGGNYIPKGGVVMPNWQIQGAENYNPPNLVTGTRDTHTLAMTTGSVAMGDRVDISFSLDLAGVHLWAYVSAPDVVTIIFQNDTGSDKNLGSGVIIVRTER